MNPNIGIFIIVWLLGFAGTICHCEGRFKKTGKQITWQTLWVTLAAWPLYWVMLWSKQI